MVKFTKNELFNVITINNVTRVTVGNDTHIFSRKVALEDIREELIAALGRALVRDYGEATVRSLKRMLTA